MSAKKDAKVPVVEWKWHPFEQAEVVGVGEYMLRAFPHGKGWRWEAHILGKREALASGNCSTENAAKMAAVNHVSSLLSANGASNAGTSAADERKETQAKLTLKWEPSGEACVEYYTAKVSKGWIAEVYHNPETGWTASAYDRRRENATVISSGHQTWQEAAQVAEQWEAERSSGVPLAGDEDSADEGVPFNPFPWLNGQVVSCPGIKEEPASALFRQVGGDHYKSMAIQPAHYCIVNGIGAAEFAVIKYVSRWKSKGGVQDLVKAKHFLDILIEEAEAGNVPGWPVEKGGE